MAINSQPQKNSIRYDLAPLTPMNLYLERAKSLSDQLRVKSSGLDYSPLHFGGVSGQQASLRAVAVVKLIDFKITETE